MTFRGQTLSRTVAKNNILRIWNKTTDEQRFDWYLDAYRWGIECLFIANLDATDQANINKICGVIAALSPVKNWRDNKKIALDMLLTGDCGHMKMFKDKAARILASDGSEQAILAILNGEKIKSFFLNIRHPHKGDNVTVDRWMIRVATNDFSLVVDKDLSITKNQYKFMADAIKLAADKVGVSPLVMQSSTWVYSREIN